MNIERNVKYIVFPLVILFVLSIIVFAIKGGIPGKGGGPKAACNDHLDNDGDGYCDFAWRNAYCNDGSIVGDQDCSSKDDNNESGTTFCGDGTCDANEDCSTCEADCGTCPIPDSCSDTDGGYVITVQGTVSGYSNENPYSFTDFCVSNSTLIEYACAGVDYYNTTVNCANQTSICLAGACI